MMSKRDAVRQALHFQRVSYVPWQINLTLEARRKLAEYTADGDVDALLDNHFLMLGDTYGYFEDIGNDCVRDYFGVIWDRSEDKDIGVVKGQQLPEPELGDYRFPDPANPIFYRNIEPEIAVCGDRFRVFNIGFSLFERAWTLRGMEDLLMDFCLNPDFVRDLLRRIADYNIAMVKNASVHDIDAIYFGDDWGQQHGLIMGYPLWKKFIYPELKRMYGAVKEAGKYLCIHSCGDVDELFDDLVGLGLDIFNPFQPEVMDTSALLEQYHGRLSFYGGLSTQRVLPYGTAAEVRAATEALLARGQNGGLIFAPAHAVEGDVPPENILAFLDVLKSQPGYR